MIKVTYTTFKDIVNQFEVIGNIKYVQDEDGTYHLFLTEGAMSLSAKLQATYDSQDILDFETNYKPFSNKITNNSMPFKSKKIGDKSLFSRVTGNVFSLTMGLNTCEFAVPYPQVKFNEIEIIGADIGDKVNLKILDTSSGTYTTIPNYQLNQFGYDVNIAKDYYSRKSNYDADLYQGMRIVMEYTSVTNKNLYINFIIHEVK